MLKPLLDKVIELENENRVSDNHDLFMEFMDNLSALFEPIIPIDYFLQTCDEIWTSTGDNIISVEMKEQDRNIIFKAYVQDDKVFLSAHIFHYIKGKYRYSSLEHTFRSIKASQVDEYFYDDIYEAYHNGAIDEYSIHYGFIVEI